MIPGVHGRGTRRNIDRAVERVLQRLPPRYEQFLRLRFKIGEAAPSSPQRVGRGSNVRRLRAAALRALRQTALQPAHG